MILHALTSPSLRAEGEAIQEPRGTELGAPGLLRALHVLAMTGVGVGKLITLIERDQFVERQKLGAAIPAAVIPAFAGMTEFRFASACLLSV
jgi:hypothetical protein